MVTQELARHSDPKLTLNTYAKLEIHDLAAALDALPAHPGTRKTEEGSELRATGTDDAIADPQQKSQHTRREVVRDRANACGQHTGSNAIGSDRKPLPVRTECDPMRPDARPCDKATERTRTVDLRFTKMLVGS